MKTLGLIINPIAGMGGAVGLKGTDGRDILAKAKALGAKPRAHARTVEALRRLAEKETINKVLSCGADMGEYALRECGLEAELLHSASGADSAAEDTRKAARLMKAAGADLLLFTGGDGTARDLHSAIGDSLVTLGIPAGVKVHSAVFAANPPCAGELAALYLQNRIKHCIEAEVMDIDEGDYRAGILSARLCGYLKIPRERKYLQRAKAGSSDAESYLQDAIAADIVEHMDHACAYIFGPGTTTGAILRRMGMPYTLLGVDMWYRGEIVGLDMNEAELLAQLDEVERVHLLLTPIGGQGYVLGRGNLQLSPDVIGRVGKANIILVATPQKIDALGGRPLLVDTGDSALDSLLCDYYEIVTGYRQRVIYKVAR